jgi:hypothetical protein
MFSTLSTICYFVFYIDHHKSLQEMGDTETSRLRMGRKQPDTGDDDNMEDEPNVAMDIGKFIFGFLLCGWLITIGIMTILDVANDQPLFDLLTYKVIMWSHAGVFFVWFILKSIWMCNREKMDGGASAAAGGAAHVCYRRRHWIDLDWSILISLALTYGLVALGMTLITTSQDQCRYQVVVAAYLVAGNFAGYSVVLMVIFSAIGNAYRMCRASGKTRVTKYRNGKPMTTL